MPPAALVIAQLVVQYGPKLALGIAEIIHSDKEPTIDDWRALLKDAQQPLDAPAAPAPMESK